MKKLLVLMVGWVFTAGEIGALPPVQHRVAGLVRSVNLEKSRVTITPEGRDEPTELAVEAKRTRLRREGVTVALSELGIGQRVEIYYRKEAEGCVATEISWRAGPAARETP